MFPSGCLFVLFATLGWGDFELVGNEERKYQMTSDLGLTGRRMWATLPSWCSYPLWEESSGRWVLRPVAVKPDPCVSSVKPIQVTQSSVKFHLGCPLGVVIVCFFDSRLLCSFQMWLLFVLAGTGGTPWRHGVRYQIAPQIYTSYYIVTAPAHAANQIWVWNQCKNRGKCCPIFNFMFFVIEMPLSSRFFSFLLNVLSYELHWTFPTPKRLKMSDLLGSF